MKNFSIIRLLQTLLVVAIVFVAIVTLGAIVPLGVTIIYVLVTGDSFMECFYSEPFLFSVGFGFGVVLIWFIRTVMKVNVMKEL